MEPVITANELKETTENTACSLCLKETAKYTCPRCNIRYCSVDCYKGSGHINCSEAFYKDCFMEGLKESQNSNEEKHRIMDMLQRVEKQDLDSDDEATESDNGQDLSERLEGLDLDTDIDAVWKKLTDGEKKEFHAMSKDGRLSQLVHVWTPWWNHKDTRLVKETADIKSHSTGVVFPEMCSTIKDLDQIIGNKKPSSDLKLHVLSLLYAYSFVCRLYNGEHTVDCLNTIQEVITLSNILDTDTELINTHDTVHRCLHRITSKEMNCTTSSQFNTSCLLDVINIILGPDHENPLHYILLALSELYSMTTAAKKHLSKGKRIYKEDHMATKKRLFFFTKKLEFFLSWTQRLGMSLSLLVPELRLEYESMNIECELRREKEAVIKGHLRTEKQPQKDLIQEIL